MQSLLDILTYGFIDRNGEIQTCCYGGHYSLAEGICIDHGWDWVEQEAERRKSTPKDPAIQSDYDCVLAHGWVALHDRMCLYNHVQNGELVLLSKKQKDKLVDIMLANRKECEGLHEGQSQAIKDCLEADESLGDIGGIAMLKVPEKF